MRIKNKLGGWFFALALCLLSAPKTSTAAVFTVQRADKYEPISVLVKGRIEPGDFEKFNTF